MERDVAPALRTTYPKNLFQAANQTGTYHVEDEGYINDEESQADENAFEVFAPEAGYGPDDEFEEQDAVDALLTWKQTRAGVAQTKLARGFGGRSGSGSGRDFKKLESRVASKLAISVAIAPGKGRGAARKG